MENVEMANARFVVDADRGIAFINPDIYGHFAERLGHCIYDGASAWAIRRSR